MENIITNKAQININGKMVLRTHKTEEQVRIYVQKTIAKKFNVDTIYVSVDLYFKPSFAELLEWTAYYSIIYSTNELN